MRNTIYLGPEIRGVVRRNQMFLDTPSEVIEKAKEICEQAKYLFVKMDDILPAKKELKRENSFLDIAYKETYKEVEKWITSTTFQPSGTQPHQ